METVTFKINGIDVTAPKGSTILEAAIQAKKQNFAHSYYKDIPTLHYLKNVQEIDNSGVCVVEVIGEQGLIPAASFVVRDGIEVFTGTPKVIEARKDALRKILEIHDRDCRNCVRSGSCELQELLHEYGFTNEKTLDKDRFQALDESAIHLVRDNNKCIRCQRCVTVCEKIQGVGAIKMTGTGLAGTIVAATGDGLGATNCVNCGQCIAVCPVGAIYEKDSINEVFTAIADPEKFVIVETAPSVRVALGELFGFPLGVDVEGRLAAALRELGFDRVFDTKFGADLTVMEEANEFLDRFQNGGTLPMFTSCCPAWVKCCEQDYPDMVPNLSTCKSPQQMTGAIAKSYFAEKEGIAKDKIVVVSVMPCTAKKSEIQKTHQSGSSVPDVDISITTRELARMLKKAEIQFEAMPSESFDKPLGLGTGAGVIFGVTGGVMEAALRTAAEKFTGKELPKLEFNSVRGMAGLKEASYELSGKNIKVAVVSGLANARVLLEKVRAGEVDYHFVEVMACPGGCVNGGGQPQQPASLHAQTDVRAARAAALYSNDACDSLRKSHENPAIIELYENYLKVPGSDKAHKLLHTVYTGD